MRKKLKNNILSLSLILIIPAINIFYGILNNSSRGAYYIGMKIDELIPFNKIFIIPYVIWYPFIVGMLIYFCFKDKKTYYKMIISILLGLIVSYIVFYFFQTGINRPTISENDTLSNMVRFIYTTDKPYNCFPSIHVLTSYLMIKGIFTYKRKNIKKILFITTISISIIISTLFVKQHVFWDIVGAVILAEVVFVVSSIYYNKNFDKNYKIQLG